MSDARRLYESELGLIRQVIDWISRRRAMRPEDAEDFASWVHEKLLENDCAVLQKFQGKSKLSTYLTTVIHNLYKDFVIAQSSKWRPSAIAKRLGWVAVALEIQISRHGHRVEDAIRFVRQELGVDLSDQELESLAARLPSRPNRVFVDLTVLETSSSGEDPAVAVERGAAREEAASVLGRLGEAFADLEADDRLILRLRFAEGLKVVSIARLLGVEAKRLYPRIDRLLKQLRGELEENGVAWTDVEGSLGRELQSWDFGLELDA